MNVRIDPSRAVAAYSSAFRKLRELEGFSQAQILRAEAGVILKTWAGRTKVANPHAAELFARYRATKRAFGQTSAGKNPYGISVNSGRRNGVPGVVWFRTKRGKYQEAGLIYPSGYISQRNIHFKDDDWARIEAGMVAYAAELKTILPGAQNAIGLARQSVIQIADALGIDLLSVRGGGQLSSAAITKARGAIASNGRFYQNGIGQAGDAGTTSYVNLFTRFPLGGKIGMDSTLALILAGRAGYIEQSYKKGAFESVRSAAKAFPNLFNLSGLN